MDTEREKHCLSPVRRIKVRACLFGFAEDDPFLTLPDCRIPVNAILLAKIGKH